MPNELLEQSKQRFAQKPELNLDHDWLPSLKTTPAPAQQDPSRPLSNKAPFRNLVSETSPTPDSKFQNLVSSRDWLPSSQASITAPTPTMTMSDLVRSPEGESILGGMWSVIESGLAAGGRSILEKPAMAAKGAAIWTPGEPWVDDVFMAGHDALMWLSGGISDVTGLDMSKERILADMEGSLFPDEWSVGSVSETGRKWAAALGDFAGLMLFSCTHPWPGLLLG